MHLTLSIAALQDQFGHLGKKRVPTKPAAERKNTAVYVSNLPMDTDVQELLRVFSRCGVVAEEIDGQKPRIKMYTDDQGNFKGDALIVYFRAESVSLAVQMLDDSQLRSEVLWSEATETC